MNHGLEQIRGKGSPISLELICDIHRILLSGVRDGEKSPGEFRDRQNWVGGPHPATTVFVPPPQERVRNLMSDLENFIRTDTPDIPTLIKAGLIHVQFETIHPFLRRQRPSRKATDNFSALRTGHSVGTSPVSQLVLQDPSLPLLQLAAARARNRRLGILARVFPGRHSAHLATGLGHSPQNTGSLQTRPRPDRTAGPSGVIGVSGLPVPAENARYIRPGRTQESRAFPADNKERL